MNNLNTLKIISKIFYVISAICKVLFIIAAVLTIALSIFLVAIPQDTVVLEAQGNAKATIKCSNLVDSPFEFIEDMEEGKTTDKGDDGEVTFEVKDGNMSGEATGYGQGVAKFDFYKDGTLVGDGLSDVYTINNFQIGIALMPKIASLVLMILAVWFAGNIFKGIKNSTTPFTDTVRKNIVRLAVAIFLLSFLPAIISKILLWSMSLSGITTTAFAPITTGFSVTSLFVAVTLLVLAIIFSHGVGLQQQADETL